MSLTAYWISNLIFDLFKGMIPSAIVIGLTVISNDRMQTKAIVLALCSLVHQEDLISAPDQDENHI